MRGWAYANEFRSQCPSSNAVPFSRTTTSARVGNLHLSADVHPDEYFSFAFQDMVIESVDYDIALSQI